MLSSQVRCLCFCKDKKSYKKKQRSKAQHKEYLFRRGEEKVLLDLDIVSLVNLIQSYRVMKKVLFEKN